MSTIATIGNLAVDRIAGAPPRAGGGVFHAARAAAHVGADAVAVTRCAPGDRATALAPLESLGLPVTCADATETTAFSFHYEGDHRVMAVDAVGEPWTPEDVEGWASAALDGAGWVLVAGLLRSHFPAPTIEALARGGRRLLLDAQGLVRLARTGPLTRDGAFDRDVLRHLAVLKLNEDEGRILAGDLEPRALRALGVPRSCSPSAHTGRSWSRPGVRRASTRRRCPGRSTPPAPATRSPSSTSTDGRGASAPSSPPSAPPTPSRS